MPAPESALVVLVPEAEGLVGPFRARHDAAAVAGMPAHVTLLYPFKPPHEIDAEVRSALRRDFAQFAPFAFTLAALRRFPGTLYLAPEPEEPFRALTLAIWRRFPETPPYGGVHPTIVPHLTVAQPADEAQFDPIAEAFTATARRTPPIRAKASEVVLMDTSAGRWERRASFALGGG